MPREGAGLQTPGGWWRRRVTGEGGKTEQKHRGRYLLGEAGAEIVQGRRGAGCRRRRAARCLGSGAALRPGPGQGGRCPRGPGQLAPAQWRLQLLRPWRRPAAIPACTQAFVCLSPGTRSAAHFSQPERFRVAVSACPPICRSSTAAWPACLPGTQIPALLSPGTRWAHRARRELGCRSPRARVSVSGGAWPRLPIPPQAALLTEFMQTTEPSSLLEQQWRCQATGEESLLVFARPGRPWPGVWALDCPGGHLILWPPQSQAYPGSSQVSHSFQFLSTGHVFPDAVLQEGLLQGLACLLPLDVLAGHVFH